MPSKVQERPSGSRISGPVVIPLPIGSGRGSLEGLRYAPTVPESDDSGGLRARGEEALGELAEALVENPLVGGALARALGAGERAASAQRQALGALNLASSSDVTRVESRVRSLSLRLEELEDTLDSLSDELAALRKGLADRQADQARAPEA